jgi:hypothetical protein
MQHHPTSSQPNSSERIYLSRVEEKILNLFIEVNGPLTHIEIDCSLRSTFQYRTLHFVRVNSNSEVYSINLHSQFWEIRRHRVCFTKFTQPRSDSCLSNTKHSYSLLSYTKSEYLCIIRNLLTWFGLTKFCTDSSALWFSPSSHDHSIFHDSHQQKRLHCERFILFIPCEYYQSII